jgi:hypothetical protein
MLTLVYRSASADLAMLERGYQAVRAVLREDGGGCHAVIERFESGRLYLQVLYDRRVSWRRVRDAWSSVGEGSVSSGRVATSESLLQRIANAPAFAQSSSPE